MVQKKLRRRKLLRNFIFKSAESTDDVGYHIFRFHPFFITAKVLHGISVLVFESVCYNIPNAIFFGPCTNGTFFFQFKYYCF